MSRTRLLFASTLLAVVAGCASFTERPKRDPYAEPAEPPAIHLVRSGEARLQTSSGRWIGMPNIAGLDADAGKAIWATAWVREAGAGDVAPTYRVHVAEHQGMGPALLSVASGFLIPGMVEHRVLVRVETDSGDGAGRSCSRSAEVRTWYQTSLLFVYPFRSPSWNRIKITEILSQNCLAELLRMPHPARETKSESG